MIYTIEPAARHRRVCSAGRPLAAALTVAAACAAISPLARGETRNWVAVSPSSWHTDSNWLTSPTSGGTPAIGVPQSGDGVVINLNGATVSYSAPANAGALYSMLDIDSPGALTATLNQSASQLHTDRLYVGINGKAAVNVTGGTLDVFGQAGLSLGLSPAANGALSVATNANLVVAGQALLGDAGTGSYTQTGGAFTVNALGQLPGEIYVAANPDAVGTFTLSGGAVTSDAFHLAPYGGNATVNHSNGSVTVRPGAGHALNVGDPTITPDGGQSVYNHTGGAVSTPELNVGAAGRFKQTGGTLKAAKVTIAPTGKLDVDQNMVVDYLPADGSPANAIRGYLLTGRNGGTWNGGGIMSTLASTNLSRGIAYGEASTLLNLTGSATTTWNGQTVDASSLLILNTLAGDANVDKKVDVQDLLLLGQNYNVLSGQVWTTGDFTYDGKVDVADLLLLGQNYNTALPSEPIPGMSAAFQADMAAVFATVPEPGTATTLLILSAGGLVARRRRRV
jgi:hypothetical protein